MTNFEWFCRDYPDYIKNILCGNPEQCFVKLDPTVKCKYPNCDGNWCDAQMAYCKEKFKKWLDEKCE